MYVTFIKCRVTVYTTVKIDFSNFSELEHLKLCTVVPATMRSFQVSNTSIVIEPSVTISNVLKLDRIFFCFVRFTSHFKCTSIVTVRLNRNIWLEQLSLFDSEYYWNSSWLRTDGLRWYLYPFGSTLRLLINLSPILTRVLISDVTKF